MTVPKLLNYINGRWVTSSSEQYREIQNPATTEILALSPLSSASELDQAAQAANKAFQIWKQVPAIQRVQYMFKMKNLLEGHFEELARSITEEHGKTLEESRGEMHRVIENIDVACGIPTMMMGDISEDVAHGIDEYMIRQPLGVAGIITPFNFPAMISFWFLPYALACGNAVVIKPSDRTPITLQKIVQLLDQLELPDGLINLVNGGEEITNAILDHPLIQSVSFVGSTLVAQHVYSRGSAHGKRVQAMGGAKNPVVIMPDADLEKTTEIIADSAFGSAGERCLAASTVITVGEADRAFTPALVEAAANRVVGYGLNPGVQMGPVISAQAKARIEGLIQKGVDEGANLLVDGRNTTIQGYENGWFIRPTIMINVPSQGEIARTEIFGPVLGMMHVDTLEEALELVNQREYGNMACIFTRDGATARKFRNEAMAGNIGVNIGVPAPMAFYPFSGWRKSFFGTLHGQGRHAVEFFTQTKVVIERWPNVWSRKF